MYFISYYVISAENFQRLLKQAEQRKKFAFTPGTKSNRMAQIKMFKNFCTEFDQDSLNPSEETITAYIEFLAQRLKSARSIFNYISGVRSFLKYNRRSTKCLDSYHVKRDKMCAKINCGRYWQVWQKAILKLRFHICCLIRFPPSHPSMLGILWILPFLHHCLIHLAFVELSLGAED